MGRRGGVKKGRQGHAAEKSIKRCSIEEAKRSVMLLVVIGYDTDFLAAFEGPQHPYRQNLLKYPGSEVKSLVKEPPDLTKQEWLGEVKI